jgi:hypothetical protein
VRLQAEGEDGMIHSLLSSLPNLVDDDIKIGAEKIDTGPSQRIKEELIVAYDDTFFKEEDELNIPATDVVLQVELDVKDEGSLDDILDEPDVPSDGRRHLFVLANEQENHSDTPGPDVLIPTVDDPPSNIAEQPPKGDESPTQYSGRSGLRASETTILVSNPIKVDKEPQPPWLTLTDLLMHSDSLYEEYPPSHSGLALSSIMGPQSVVFTWSESPSALPSDNMAEAMVSHPELVVYHYLEIYPDQKETGAEENEGHNKATRRKRGSKLRKPLFGQMEKKTVLAGTVIVLGIAVAVYGIKARNGPGDYGLFQAFAGDYHAHGAVARDWKGVGGWVGGALAGMSQKILKGLSSGSRHE